MRQIAIADGSTEAVRKAAAFALEIQDAVNFRALVAHWLDHIDAMRKAGADSDTINNHPSTLVVLSKLNSLARMTQDRENAAWNACRVLQEGKQTEYEVIPL
jgi:hypothetical protein